MAADFRAIREAVIDYWRASQVAGTCYAAVGGRLYWPSESTPQGDDATLPYIVIDDIDLSPADTFNATIEARQIQVRCFTENDIDGAAVELIASKFQRRFDGAALTYDGSEYANVVMRRIAGGGGPMGAGPDVKPGDMMFVLMYEILAQEV